MNEDINALYRTDKLWKVGNHGNREMSRIITRVYQREHVMILSVGDYGVFKNGYLCTYIVRERWKNVTSV